MADTPSQSSLSSDIEIDPGHAERIEILKHQVGWFAEYVGEATAGALFSDTSRVERSVFTAFLTIPEAFRAAEAEATDDPTYVGLRDFLGVIKDRLEQQVGWEVIDHLRAASAPGVRGEDAWDEFEFYLERFKASVSGQWKREQS